MGGKLISTFLLGMYFLYLTISRRALEIFNCNPVEPDDGFTYTHFTSINCDGGLCRCWDPNHVQLFLVPFSIVAILLMTVGFPVWLFLLLRSKKNAIKEDQYLRALDIAPVETNNPVAFFNRLKYHKMWVFYLCCDVLMFWFLIFGFAIDAGDVGVGFSTDLAMPFLCFPNLCHHRYYHFKPGKVYWIVFIIARKGLISAAGLLFRSNPGFQLSFVLLVLFWAYVQQVQNKPFMSSVERKTVILEHQVKVTMGDQLHIQLAARIAVAKAEERKSRAKQRNKQRNKLVNDFVGNSTGEQSGNTALHLCSLEYFLLKPVLETDGVNLNAQDFQGSTALMKSSLPGATDSKCVGALLEAGADASLLDTNRRSALFVAAGAIDAVGVEIVKLLLDTGQTNVNLKSGGYNATNSTSNHLSRNLTPLFAACQTAALRRSPLSVFKEVVALLFSHISLR